MQEKRIAAKTLTDSLLESLNKKVSTLEETNQKLVAANGSLLQQIPAVADNDKRLTEEAPAEKKAFNFRSVFDKNGKFKNDL